MLYFILAALLVLADQLVKYLVSSNIPLGGSVPFLPHLMDLTFVKNTGCAKLLWMSLSANDPEGLLNAYAPSLERWKPFMDGIILFEAYQMTGNPEYWEFIRNF